MKRCCPSFVLESLGLACALASAPAWAGDAPEAVEAAPQSVADWSKQAGLDPCAQLGAPARCWMLPGAYSALLSRGFDDESQRRRAIVASWPTRSEWAPSSEIVERGRQGQNPWMTGLAAALGGYKTYDALHSNERSMGIGRFLGLAADRLEILPGRMGQDSGAKGIVGVSLYSCRGRCLDLAGVRKMDVSLVVNPHGDAGQRQIVLGAKMLFQ